VRSLEEEKLNKKFLHSIRGWRKSAGKEKENWIGQTPKKEKLKREGG